jgi:hypothetical protein
MFSAVESPTTSTLIGPEPSTTVSTGSSVDTGTVVLARGIVASTSTLVSGVASTDGRNASARPMVTTIDTINVAPAVDGRRNSRRSRTGISTKRWLTNAITPVTAI